LTFGIVGSGDVILIIDQKVSLYILDTSVSSSFRAIAAILQGFPIVPTRFIPE